MTKTQKIRVLRNFALIQMERVAEAHEYDIYPEFSGGCAYAYSCAAERIERVLKKLNVTIEFVIEELEKNAKVEWKFTNDFFGGCPVSHEVATFFVNCFLA